MIAQRYWAEHKADFILEAKSVTSATEMMEVYRRFTAGLKTHVLSAYRQNAVLQQLIALLFAENELGAEMLLSREEPSIVIKPSEAKKRSFIWEKVLLNPILIYGLLLAGFIMSLYAIKTAWFCAIFFVATAGAFYIQSTSGRSAQVQHQARAAFSSELVAAYLDRQVQQLDAHIDDLQALMKALTLPGSNLPIEMDSLTLCQLVWANAHQGYPAESMLFAAEQLLNQNGLEWADFSEETRSFYQIMPTRQTSRTVYPALRRVEDGTLVCKGQYLEKT